MKDISLKDLLEAGCHFGHQTNRWHPKAGEYIYTSREGVHVIDLAKTRDGLVKAAQYLLETAKNGGSIIFVGTKRQSQEIVKEAANKVRSQKPENSNFYYLLERWPGGLLTNFDIIKKNNLDTIIRLQDDINNNNFVTKKEKLLAQRKLDRYNKLYGGLVGLQKTPTAIFIVDIRKEAGAIREAISTKTDIVAITDTNVNPEPVNYNIPANDDAVGSLKIIIEYLTDAWLEGLNSKKNDNS